MEVRLANNKKVDLSKPIDISIPLDGNSTTAWYVEHAEITPVKGDGFIGKVSEGGSVNFNNIIFNPHGHGTHTECVGHITPEFHSINQTLKTFHFDARLITLQPVLYKEKETEWRKKGDYVITKKQLVEVLKETPVSEALIIRTTPNKIDKLVKNWSENNWAYLEEEAAAYIADLGIKHLLIDLPSVDREFDGGKLLAHKAFWKYPNKTRLGATITEMIYVPNTVADGAYFLNLQIASFENDASPSKPVLYDYLP
ncbi:MAG: cyclase family protein [Flavobacteriales bacterium]|jgi:kynurenine formamidase|nr:cyclase family protein [Flavobacteriales bacterium]